MDYENDYVTPGSSQEGTGEEALCLPTFEDGRAIRPGDRVKLPDGSLMRVETIAFSGAHVFLSDTPIHNGEKRFVPVDGHAMSPDKDSLEEIEADLTLSAAEYCRKRAINVPDGEKANKQVLMNRDLYERQLALSMA